MAGLSLRVSVLHRAPARRVIVVLLMLAMLVSGTGAWLAQAIGPRHWHAATALSAPAFEDFRRIVVGHGAVRHDHDALLSHRHAGGDPEVKPIGAGGADADAAAALIEAGLAAAAALAPGGAWRTPQPLWVRAARILVATPFPASHESEPESPPPKNDRA